MKAKESIFIYRYRRSIHGKQWCPCIIVGNKFPVESHVLIYIEENGEQRYRYRTVDTRDLCLAKNQDCFPNLERALMACKIRYDYIAPHGASFWMDFKESGFWDLFDGYITGKYKTLHDIEAARNEFLVPAYQYKFYL